jgi:hypothetical protein
MALAMGLMVTVGQDAAMVVVVDMVVVVLLCVFLELGGGCLSSSIDELVLRVLVS